MTPETEEKLNRVCRKCGAKRFMWCKNGSGRTIKYQTHSER
jgi:hypothetical protein